MKFRMPRKLKKKYGGLWRTQLMFYVFKKGCHNFAKNILKGFEKALSIVKYIDSVIYKN